MNVSRWISRVFLLFLGLLGIGKAQAQYLSKQEIAAYIRHVDSLKLINKLEKYQNPQLSECCGTVYGFYEKGKLVFVDATLRAEQGSTHRTVYIKDTTLYRLSCLRHFAGQNTRPSSSKSLKDKANDPTILNATDTLYKVWMTEVPLVRKTAGPLFVSEQPDTAVLNELVLSAEHMKRELSTSREVLPPLLKPEALPDDFRLDLHLNSFDTTITALIRDTQELNDCQQNTYDGFLLRQDSLMPFILEKIFENYKISYPSRHQGAALSGIVGEAELEDYIPVPSTPDNLKAYLTPLTLTIRDQKNCKLGCFSLVFECTWDVEHTIGVIVKDWKVTEAALGLDVY
jgi:hypothetical protein